MISWASFQGPLPPRLAANETGAAKFIVPRDVAFRERLGLQLTRE